MNILGNRYWIDVFPVLRSGYVDILKNILFNLHRPKRYTFLTAFHSIFSNPLRIILRAIVTVITVSTSRVTLLKERIRFSILIR